MIISPFDENGIATFDGFVRREKYAFIVPLAPHQVRNRLRRKSSDFDMLKRELNTCVRSGPGHAA